jgi:hypothetical protein
MPKTSLKAQSSKLKTGLSITTTNSVLAAMLPSIAGMIGYLLGITKLKNNNVTTCFTVTDENKRASFSKRV